VEDVCIGVGPIGFRLGCVLGVGSIIRTLQGVRKMNVFMACRILFSLSDSVQELLDEFWVKYGINAMLLGIIPLAPFPMSCHQ
jgi:hypothetical protein